MISPFHPWVRSPAFVRAVLCLFTCLGVCLADNSTPPEPAAEEEAPVAPAQPELSRFEELWTRSVFTSRQDSMPAAAPEVKAEWADNLSLSGWAELNGRRSAYLVRKDNGEVILIEDDSLEKPDDYQLLEIENSGLLLGMRARVKFRGQEAWVCQQEEAEPAADATPTSAQPAAAAQPPGTPLKAPTTVDSRAARLRPGIVLGANTTFNDSLTQPGTAEQQPGAETEASPVTNAPELPPEQRTNINFIQMLRERNEHQYSSFPRPPGQ